ncbi:RHS repeat protein [Morganella morganii]|uniref:RHS repeat protein n=1 Tax=Morganella morganii TaxID=582 RepID=UPI001C445ECA|nr:RHS repeat domain-containing protein [Morganella morganii]QXO71224.1 RHS repeat protein [Morganella morganii]
MNTSLFSKTPAVTVLNNRGQTILNIAYHRHPESPDITTERITRHQYDARGFLTQSADPRLAEAGLANFTYRTDLRGGVLRTQGADNGITVSLNDVAGRPFIAVNNIGTADNGTDDRRQAVTRTWQYEDASLAGRPLSITEQTNGGAACITERFVYAGNTDAEKALNLAGQLISHYDTAGLEQTNSIALTGVPLSVTRRLLKNADNSDTMADWQGENVPVWNNLLDNDARTTLTTADTTGSILTTTDAQGNMQRMAYDVAGLLSGSWLTLKGGTEKVIVASLTYSAAGQKLREEHGNGVITTYSYEPETQRLNGIKTERPAGHAAGLKILQDLRYEYDPVGNVLKVTNDAEETRFWRNQKVVPENTYAYDSLYQLISATGREMANAGQQGSGLPPLTVPLPADSSAYTNYTRRYTYDTAGNLTQISHRAPAANNSYTTKITISNRSNRGVLSTLTENPADVDALFTNGGQQKQLQPGQRLDWTPRNKLLKVTPVVRNGDADDSEIYRYDADSRRILKVSRQKTGSSTQTQRVQYLPGLELRTIKAGDTQTESLQVIIAGDTGQIRLLHRENGDDQMRWSYSNLIGSSGLELDGKGNIISMEEYYPYGGTAVWTARSVAEAEYKTVRYSGKERDATGLYYYGYRYYQPWAGRWLSADPAGTMDGLNLFRMVRNNPLRFFDTNGLAPTEEKSQQAIGRTYIKEAKYLAAEQLSAAEKFLNNTSNNDVALDIYKTFFGQHMGEEKLGIWKTQIKNVSEGINKLDTKRNVRYSPLKTTASGEKSGTVAAEANMQAFQRGEKIYINSYTDVLEKVKKNETLGVDHLAHILIHEMSHLRLDTEDMAYIGVAKNEGYHDLNAMLALLDPEKLQAGRGEPEETIKQRRARGSLDAVRNADSFTTATRYLAYTAKSADFYHRFAEQKKTFTHGASSLIKSPRWK